jgi:hypothetical protein
MLRNVLFVAGSSLVATAYAQVDPLAPLPEAARAPVPPPTMVPVQPRTMVPVQPQPSAAGGVH